MRISGRISVGIFAATLIAPTCLAQLPGPAFPVPGDTVRVRLSPDLGNAMPKVRAALLGLPSLRVAEPAYYEITTKPDFPQTLVAIDVLQSEGDWANDFSRTPVRPAPRTIQLGNLAFDDFTGRLRLLIDRRDRANRLLEIGRAQEKSPRPRIDTCLISENNGETLENCHEGRIRYDPNVQGLPDWLEGDTFFHGKLANRSTRPRYAALLVLDPWLGISRIAARYIGETAPLAPAASVDTDLLNFGYSSGDIILVTVTSDHPIDTSAIEQLPLKDPAWDDCLQESAGCARPLFEIPAGWSIALAEYHYRAPRLVGIGGGLDVTEGMAPWMAEIYSTVPFKPEEIAADSRLPDTDKDKKHLAERNQRELDHRCGGTLIGPRLVLTAAHCVANAPFAGANYPRVLTDRRVRVGTKRLGMGGSTLAIDGAAVPADYVAGSQDNDIALLLLRPDRDTRRYGDDVISLGTKPIVAGTRVTAFGWGYTGTVAPDKNALFNVAAELQRNPDQLQYGQMAALDWDACKRRLKKLGPGMVCLVAPGAESGASPDKNVFSCRGDSGGPLVRKVGESEELVGVTSWSLGCGYKDIPSVYTDVTKYRRWIAAAMQQIRPGQALRIDEKAAPSP